MAVAVAGASAIISELQVDSWLQRLIYLLTLNSGLSNSRVIICC